jgi:hypothetical protein
MIVLKKLTRLRLCFYACNGLVVLFDCDVNAVLAKFWDENAVFIDDDIRAGSTINSLLLKRGEKEN